MKSIPVQVEGPALTSGQSPTYYEYNNGLTGIIEPRASPASRSIALLHPLCRFMTPCDGEEDSLPVSLDLDPGDTCSLGDSTRKKSAAPNSALFSLSFLSACRVLPRAIGSRAIDFVLAQVQVREGKFACEKTHFFPLFPWNETSMSPSIENLHRVSRSFIFEPLEPSFIPFRACHGERIFRRAVKTSFVRIFLSFESYIEWI